MSLEQRKKFVNAFNATMIKIWRERISLLGVVDTGTLYRSILDFEMTADRDYVNVTLGQSFRTYGLFVDWGTGRNTPRDNSGDLGPGFENRRKPKLWFSLKYYASVMKLREFYADSVGKDFCRAVSAALSRDAMRQAVTIPD